MEENEEKLIENEIKNEEKSIKKSKKHKKSKRLLADFLSKTYMIDKDVEIYLLKKEKNKFQFVSPQPFKPPIRGEEIYNEYGDGIYRIDLRKDGKPVYPNTIFFKIEQGDIKEIVYSEENINEEKTQINPLQGAIILTPEAVKELISALKQQSFDLSPVFNSFKEFFKNISDFQKQIFTETFKTQMDILKNSLKKEFEEEEEEEEEITQDDLIKAIQEGKWDIVDEILIEILGEKAGKKISKLLRFAEAYTEAQKIKEEIKKGGENEQK